jgi:hypothetical protein
MHLSLLEPLGAHAPLPVIARRPAHLVGNTPVLWIDDPFAPPGRGFYAKLEGTNPADAQTSHRARRSWSPPAEPSAWGSPWPG